MGKYLVPGTPLGGEHTAAEIRQAIEPPLSGRARITGGNAALHRISGANRAPTQLKKRRPAAQKTYEASGMPSILVVGQSTQVDDARPVDDAGNFDQPTVGIDALADNVGASARAAGGGHSARR
jgi:hypothetical protein